ncbi:hypothetical protein CaCOL14_000206 [Colletotrichum acutatum]
MTPAGSIALLVILVIGLICTIIWLAKDQVHTFVKALADHRAARKEASTTANTEATSNEATV